MRYALDDEQAEIVGALCEALVPGSGAVGPVAFIDSVAAEMPAGQRAALREAIAALEPVRRRGVDFLDEERDSQHFGLILALAIDAYYSDFAEPGYEGPTAWDAIDFNSPQGRRLRKDWSFLRCYR